MTEADRSTFDDDDVEADEFDLDDREVTDGGENTGNREATGREGEESLSPIEGMVADGERFIADPDEPEL